ncbi:2-polyprenyl-3-methyl-5-hydroxy-6-metoxy-1,4-benzoquinol methylase [Parabacteroides sp. PM6-13]|uniref:class I SAM-dependent methyltransferase n=1 Tax=Parabacteroides sp. PM6-13 TaxID=1742408 RepID=UPI002476DCBA|nr:class I SAM-dependent methyltransferase [Parabacteroides sp. PM6-13]MDH6343560.1 2-polyprenyl-3-methyl-5-hydroxy-6-metoxy-1,4-benzoquinol methylase [Parabacteroides sp. PM6-13]
MIKKAKVPEVMPHPKRQTIMQQPHDNWGTYYDFVYEQTFGSFYSNLTLETLNVINQILPKGTILDFGAGTGRLSLPLAEQGYKLIAVEKSIGMTNNFKGKLYRQNSEIEIHNCSISEYKNGKADLAIALFTVISYSITEEELSKNIENICKHINTNGYFFFDLPNTVFFNTGRLTNIETKTFKRIVELTSNNENNVYTYREQCSGIFNGQEFSYEDKFKIRYWEVNTLDKLLKENGLNDTLISFPQFNSTGSTYKLYKKQ